MRPGRKYGVLAGDRVFVLQVRSQCEPSSESSSEVQGEERKIRLNDGTALHKFPYGTRALHDPRGTGSDGERNYQKPRDRGASKRQGERKKDRSRAQEKRCLDPFAFRGGYEFQGHRSHLEMFARERERTEKRMARQKITSTRAG